MNVLEVVKHGREEQGIMKCFMTADKEAVYY